MSEKIKYLYDNKEIGDILAEGFAKICDQKPAFPINALATYLKSHSLKKQQKKQMIQKLEHNQNILSKLEQIRMQLQKKMDQKVQQNKIKLSQKQSFLQKIKQCTRHEFILDYFCEWVANSFKLTGVYIAELQNQSKIINTNYQDSQEAHLELDKQKIINFKYANESQRKIVIGKILTQESVTGRLLNQVPTQDNPTGQQTENAQEKTKPQAKGEVYFDSVVGNQELKFFRFPKLGAFYAISVTLKSYLKQKLFDENTAKVQNYRKILQEYQKEIDERQNKFKQIYQEKVNGGAEEKDLEQLQKQFQREKSQVPVPPAEPYDFFERKFVICFDTLGLDKSINDEDKKKLRQLVSILRQSWQSSQKSQLTKDIQSQLQLTKPLPQQDSHQAEIVNFVQLYTTLLEQQQKEVASHQQVQKVKDNEKLLQLQSNTQRFEKNKDYLLDEKYLVYWDHLLQLNVIKYKQIIKQFLILLQYKKDDLCIKGTSCMDWEKTKKLLLKDRQIIHQQISKLSCRGNKPNKVLPYAKCARIQKNIEGLQPSNIIPYNIYLAFILRLLKTYTKTRVQDKQRRVQKIQIERQNRQQKIKELQEKINEKKEKLEALKIQLQQKGEIEAFNQQAWLAQYDEQNPLLQAPPEVFDQYDGDLQQIKPQSAQG